MKKRGLVVLILFWSLFLTGFVNVNSKTVKIAGEQVITDDVILIGTSVFEEGLVEGDCMVLAREIIAAGITKGDRLFLARGINLSGESQQDVRLAGRDISIKGNVKGNVLGLGNGVDVGSAARLGGNLLALGSHVSVMGIVDGSVRVLGGTVVVGGNIGGDVTVEAGRLVLQPGATVRGNLVYSTPGAAQISEGVKIVGTIMHREAHFLTRVMEIIQYGYAGIGFFWLIKVLNFFSLLLVGFFLLKFFPVFSSAAAGHITGGVGKALGWGFSGMVLVPFLVVLCFGTLVAAPLGIVLFAGYAAVLVICKVIVSLWLGQALTRGWDEHRTVPFIMGAVLVSLFSALPVVGFFFWLLVAAAGFGGILLAYRSGVHLPVSHQTNSSAKGEY